MGIPGGVPVFSCLLGGPTAACFHFLNHDDDTTEESPFILYSRDVSKGS